MGLICSRGPRNCNCPDITFYCWKKPASAVISGITIKSNCAQEAEISWWAAPGQVTIVLASHLPKLFQNQVQVLVFVSGSLNERLSSSPLLRNLPHTQTVFYENVLSWSADWKLVYLIKSASIHAWFPKPNNKNPNSKQQTANMKSQGLWKNMFKVIKLPSLFLLGST